MSAAPPLRRARKEFFERSEVIIEGWVRKRQQGKADSESPNAWFKRKAYALLCDYVDRDLIPVFETEARRDRRPNKLIDETRENPFNLGLLAMFVDESLSRSNRHVFGNQMLYAYKHGVPPEFLNGFLAVSGGPAIIAQKLKDGFVEPGFEARIRGMGGQH